MEAATLSDLACDLSQEVYRICNCCGSGAVEVVITHTGIKKEAFHRGETIAVAKETEKVELQWVCRVCKMKGGIPIPAKV